MFTPTLMQLIPVYVPCTATYTAGLSRLRLRFAKGPSGHDMNPTGAGNIRRRCYGRKGRDAAAMCAAFQVDPCSAVHVTDLFKLKVRVECAKHVSQLSSS